MSTQLTLCFANATRNFKWDLFNLGPNIFKILMFKHFRFQLQCFYLLMKRIKNDTSLA